ncbi:hypothetical protein NAT51_14340 [Flavobacterium amniphilum]|uniref:YybH family protein n=1 Tax=Flavobacterium amniphilum TaxID=1834035 RepID=UPI00202A7E6A|nr:DUF4440 domain-containing protein [Flavobacterium amniphilum]MCL9806709.1 hypothetical protein [Flavobacterium amniphilum]
MKKVMIILSSFLLLSCTKQKDKTVLQEEIRKTEQDFNDSTSKDGIANAFYTFASEDAVIKRENDTLIKGKKAIKVYYSNPKFAKATVTWKPDFIDVSEDGTMGYTYGKYVWTATDSIGNKKEFKGVFHTVWSKQSDGSWKYVWD